MDTDKVARRSLFSGLDKTTRWSILVVLFFFLALAAHLGGGLGHVLGGLLLGLLRLGGGGGAGRLLGAGGGGLAGLLGLLGGPDGLLPLGLAHLGLLVPLGHDVLYKKKNNINFNLNSLFNFTLQIYCFDGIFIINKKCTCN